MSVKATVDGVTFEFDSSQDAAAFLKALKSGVEAPTESTPDDQGPSMAARLSSFYQAVKKKDKQRSVLKSLYETQSGLKDRELVTRIPMKNTNELGGVISGIGKTAKASGLTLGQLIERRRQKTVDGKPMYYKLTALAREFLSPMYEQ